VIFLPSDTPVRPGEYATLGFPTTGEVRDPGIPH
jgi:hypothetical protein